MLVPRIFGVGRLADISFLIYPRKLIWTPPVYLSPNCKKQVYAPKGHTQKKGNKQNPKNGILAMAKKYKLHGYWLRL